MISLINILIGGKDWLNLVTIRALTEYERDYTFTNYQASYALKAISAQLINSIIIPMMANYFIKSNVYGANGLIDDIFSLGITNSIVTPILKMVDIPYIIRTVKHYFRNKPGNSIIYVSSKTIFDSKRSQFVSLKKLFRSRQLIYFYRQFVLIHLLFCFTATNYMPLRNYRLCTVLLGPEVSIV